MDLLTVGLILSAAVLHASWHAVVKSGRNQTITLAGMGLVSAAFAVWALPFVPLPRDAAWLVIGAAAVLHSGYKICLANAYRLGDLVQAFPLARGTVPVFAIAIAYGTLGQLPTRVQLAGTLLVAVGVLSIASEVFKGAFKPHLLLPALGAGIAVATYTVLDAYGTRLYGDWLGFTAWLVVVDSLTFLALSRIAQGRAVWVNLVRMRRPIVASGVLGLGSFSVFLWALSRNPVGLVSALRETSIFFAMVIGALVYRERLSTRRVFGGILIVCGVFVITAFRCLS